MLYVVLFYCLGWIYVICLERGIVGRERLYSRGISVGGRCLGSWGIYIYIYILEESDEICTDVK